MISLREAQSEVLAGVKPLGTEALTLAEAASRRLAAMVSAPHPVPPFANSAMDGYALRAQDVAAVPVTLPVVGEIAAGQAPHRQLEPGTTMRIMTGAPMPPGADAVVRVEDATLTADGVVISAAVPPGHDVRPVGGDLTAGTTVGEPGDELHPARLGLLASVGAAAVPVYRRPRVAVLSTGDELREPAEPDLPFGAIRDANRATLKALCAEAGAAVDDLGIVGDDPASLRAVLAGAGAAADVVVSSGGVSMGVYDPVKRAYEDSGDVQFRQVAMQPGKPFAHGSIGKARFFGLPGNPVSVLVSFEQFVRPVLLALAGSPVLFRPRIPVCLGETVATNPDKVVFVRVEVEQAGDGWTARRSGGQASNVLSALAAANGLAVVPVGVGTVQQGGSVQCEMLRWPPNRTSEEALGE
ncbi:MAG: gephyrin-like molybdotransferase Glp [Acidimicrobiia bacterium]